MSRAVSLVQLVEIASPCTASWEDMQGDDRSRFCSHCRLNVYNLSAMTEEEGERLIIEKEGKLCGRIYRRKDGTVITKDCPVGLAEIRRRTMWLGAKTAAALLVIAVAAWRAIGRLAGAETLNVYNGSQWVQRPVMAFDRLHGMLARWMNEQAPVAFAGDIAPAPIANTANTPTALAPPEPVTKEALAAMSLAELKKQLVEISDARKHAKDQPELEARLKNETAMVFEEMKKRKTVKKK